MDPAVSVIMPVRDGGAWLRGAVDSILQQTLADLELERDDLRPDL